MRAFTPWRLSILPACERQGLRRTHLQVPTSLRVLKLNPTYDAEIPRASPDLFAAILGKMQRRLLSHSWKHIAITCTQTQPTEGRHRQLPMSSHRKNNWNRLEELMAFIYMRKVPRLWLQPYVAVRSRKYCRLFCCRP
jgi:hypothetical protein